MRLIDADELVLDTDAYCNDASGCYKSIADAPTIDAVSVVRCKNCKKCYKDTDALTKQTVFICQKHKYEFDWEKVEADDYCSYGEREGE